MNPIELDTQLCRQLPPWYREILDYQQICQTETAQFEALAQEITGVAENFFFQTMGLSGVEMWEQIFHIIPNPSAEDLDFRRYRVLNRISTKPPFTLGFLYQKLDELVGKGKWEVNVDYPNYTLYIKSSAINQSYAIEVAYTVNHINPAHIVYINQPFLSEGLSIDESVSLTQLVYNYKLGAWGLGVNPFVSEQDKGVIVLPEQRTMQTALLTDTANFVESDIASVRINGTTTISDITKSVSGSIVTVEYTVNSAQAQTVTQIEFLNSSGDALTSASVYVPITDPVTFTHSIPVQEATT